MKDEKKKMNTKAVYFGQYEDDWYYRDLFKVPVKDTTPVIKLAQEVKDEDTNT